MTTVLRQPKYEQVATNIREQISRGDLRPGDRLPTVVEMCSLFGVSIGTIDKATNALEQDGLIRRVPGSGVYIADLQRTRTGLIGLVGGQEQPQKFGMHFYSTYLQEGMRAAARRHGLHLVLLDRESDAATWPKLDGVVTTNDLDYEINLVRQNILPGTAWVSGLVEVPGLPSLVADEEGGIRAAVRHLRGLGHSRIGYLCSSFGTQSARRQVAFEAEMRATGEWHPNWMRFMGDITQEPNKFVGVGQRDMATWLQGDWKTLGFTAMLYQNDQTAIGALWALQAAGLRVPEDVSVIGHDGTEAAELSTPRLTTVEIPLYDLGAAAVELLQQILTGEKVAPETRRLPSRLKEGASTGPKK